MASTNQTRPTLIGYGEDGAFIFDANTLLNLYRYTESTRKDFILALTKLRDKLYMPYQVGHEFHSNRHFVIDSLNKSYKNLSTSIKEICTKNINNTIDQYARHPSIQIENIKKIQDDFVSKIDSELEKQKKNHPDFFAQDDILSKLTELYENKVGPEFSKSELADIYVEGRDRYKHSIPPGYKDFETKGKKGDQHIYGDLIIWKQLLSYALSDKKEIVFITDDRKEDWWTIENGKTIRPRAELIKEFHDLTGLRIVIYNADSFLHHAKGRGILTRIKDATINEVKSIRHSDENYITALNVLKGIDSFKKTSQWYNPSLRPAQNYLIDTIYKIPKTWEDTFISYNPELLKASEALHSLSQWYPSPIPAIEESLKNLNIFSTSLEPKNKIDIAHKYMFGNDQNSDEKINKNMNDGESKDGIKPG
jgi:hypothetical protein